MALAYLRPPNSGSETISNRLVMSTVVTEEKHNLDTQGQMFSLCGVVVRPNLRALLSAQAHFNPPNPGSETSTSRLLISAVVDVLCHAKIQSAPSLILRPVALMALAPVAEDEIYQIIRDLSSKKQTTQTMSLPGYSKLILKPLEHLII
ncbi:hypothetical protein J6590_024807 [Homalodisca vitripennis]|nr:hypothetical protein J6590_024807 [Homalodisca vitripennis]